MGKSVLGYEIITPDGVEMQIEVTYDFRGDPDYYLEDVEDHHGYLFCSESEAVKYIRKEIDPEPEDFWGIMKSYGTRGEIVAIYHDSRVWKPEA